MVFDPDAARRGGPTSCDNCDVADAVCAAYRHALKDIARGDVKDAQLTAMQALDDGTMHRLGQMFHKVIKAAVQLVNSGPTSEAAYNNLVFAVEQVRANPGATVKGWVSEKI